MQPLHSGYSARKLQHWHIKLQRTCIYIINIYTLSIYTHCVTYITAQNKLYSFFQRLISFTSIQEKTTTPSNFYTSLDNPVTLFVVKTQSFLVQHLPKTQQGENSPRLCNYLHAQTMINFTNAWIRCLSKTSHLNLVFAIKHKNL